LDLFVPFGADATQRELVLLAWYRKELKARIPDLIVKWQAIIGVQIADWGVKRMKTKWVHAISKPIASGPIWNWPRNLFNALNTSWFMRWFICSNDITMTDSLN
jgi:hypothetical protein